MTRTRMLDGTYCYTGASCRKHADAIRETVLTGKQVKDLTREERVFIARRQFDTERNLKSFENTNAVDGETWWQCPVAEDHRWQKSKSRRTSRGDGCPFCSGHRPSSTNNLADCSPTVASELIWAPDGKTARTLTVGSNEMCGWRCKKCGHEWKATPNSRQVNGCNNCRPYTGGFVLTFENSVAGRYPHLVPDFDVAANGCSADQVSAGTTKNCHWCCHNCNHKWETSPSNRGRRGDRCPACAGKVARVGESLADLYPVIAMELDEQASNLLAKELKPGSGKMGTWRCSVNPDHDSWTASIRSRTGHNQFGTQFGCPACTLAHSSTIEQDFRTALGNELGKLLPSHARLPIGWRKNKNMAVDIVGERAGAKVAIEYDSHYYHRSKVDAERDLAKTKALLAADYKVIRVREGKLPFLNHTDKNLCQLPFTYPADSAKIMETVRKVLLWLDI